MDKKREHEWRRFEIICGEEQKKTFLALLNKKGLTREDLLLILKSVKIRQSADSE